MSDEEMSYAWAECERKVAQLGGGNIRKGFVLAHNYADCMSRLGKAEHNAKQATIPRHGMWTTSPPELLCPNIMRPETSYSVFIMLAFLTVIACTWLITRCVTIVNRRNNERMENRELNKFIRKGG